LSDVEPTAFHVPFRVRFDEAAPDGLLRTSSALRYAQDLAWQHSAERGFDRAWYDEHALTWMVRAARVEILAPVGVGSSIDGSTQVVGFRRVWSRRRSTFTDDAGATLALVDIDWVLLDGRFAPTRIPAVFGEVFRAPDATFPLGRVPLDGAPSDAARRRFVVRPQELDPLDHVNNAVYADWLDEAIIGSGDLAATQAIPRIARLEYASAAGPGEAVETIAWRADGGWSVRLDGPDGVERLRARLEVG
jgi:acyl-ACP thioesterase